MLTRLVRDYDEQHSTLLRERAMGRKPSPIALLKYLIAEHGMNTVSLGKLVGGSGQASMILNGKRELSKAISAPSPPTSRSAARCYLNGSPPPAGKAKGIRLSRFVS